MLDGRNGSLCTPSTRDTYNRSSTASERQPRLPAQILGKDYFLLSFFNHFVASRRTLAGAVPPWLVRLSTERSTGRILNAALVMRGSIACMVASDSLSSGTPACSAAATMRPVM